MPPEVHFNFLNKEMLCTLCLKIMEKYKTSYAAKGQDFIEKLKASCKGFSNKHEIRRCENGFTDEAIDILIKNNAHEICEIARFCKANEQPLEKDNEDNIDAFSNVAAIPEVQKDAAIKD
uniref:Saposin B-type domain-containing protein n=1 Tax=Rhabditophanes sp. KR3021 TaxID=114890 RepID=A0AC35U6G5_9BILA